MIKVERNGNWAKGRVNIPAVRMRDYSNIATHAYTVAHVFLNQRVLRVTLYSDDTLQSLTAEEKSPLQQDNDIRSYLDRILNLLAQGEEIPGVRLNFSVSRFNSILYLVRSQKGAHLHV